MKINMDSEGAKGLAEAVASLSDISREMFENELALLEPPARSALLHAIVPAGFNFEAFESWVDLMGSHGLDGGVFDRDDGGVDLDIEVSPDQAEAIAEELERLGATNIEIALWAEREH